MKKKAKNKFSNAISPSVCGFAGSPDDCFDLINQYGTYNIQPTADSDNPYPSIAQGLPRSLNHADRTEKETKKS